MDDWVPIFVGGGLCLLGLGLVRWHVVSWSAHKAASLDETEFEFHHRQYRRRMLTSGAISVVGIMIVVGDQVFVRNPDPMAFGFYFGTVLLILIWIMFRGMRDLLSISVFSRVSSVELSRRQRELRAEYERLRNLRSDDRNGNGASN